VTRVETNVPLAGPAQREARVVAETIVGGQRRFRGVQATAVLGFGDMTVATTGESQQSLARQRQQGKIDFDWDVVYVHPGSHAEYYPQATTMHLKLLFRKDDGRVLGAQAVGFEGVERRIDVLSMAIQCNATVQTLAEAELCYAPAYGSAKDPINMAGMVATNALEGLSPLASWNNVLDANNNVKRTILDCRHDDEHQAQHIAAPNQHTTIVNIPLEQLRSRHSELSRNESIAVHCVVGQRAHSAVRLLRQLGYDASNLSGGITTFQLLTKSDNYIVCSSMEQRDHQLKTLVNSNRQV
jgi:rhodanese-related sulfurtransferase